jgi:hypothetical protein
MPDFPNQTGEAIDISNYSLEEWIKFIFDHPVVIQETKQWRLDPKPFKEKKLEEEWYWKAEWKHSCNDEVVLKNTILLFNNPFKSLKDYTDEQVNQGLKCIVDHEGLNVIVYNSDISILLRENSIKSVEILYKDLFSKREIVDATFMWWDWMRWAAMTFSTNDEKHIQKTILETCQRILKIKSAECQKGALHGLGHLGHPKAKEIIEDYLVSNPKLEEETKQYALACVSGRIL